MTQIPKGLISECEEIAENTAAEFINRIEEKTFSFREYRFAYMLALDNLKHILERNMPK